MRSLASLDVKGKRVLIREDFNVPMENGAITSDARIRAAIPTLQWVLQKGGYPIVLSHLGRPEEGHWDEQFSLKSVASALEKLTQIKVQFITDPFSSFDVKDHEITLLENVRFLSGEEKNDPILAEKLANLADIVVMDAFATAHRAQASTEGMLKKAKIACAGPLLEKEMTALGQAFLSPKMPLVAVVGGAKVSTKIDVIESLLKKCQILIIGGGMANTFLAARGVSVGKSLVEPQHVETAKHILKMAEAAGVAIHLPKDVRVAKTIQANEKAVVRTLVSIAPDEIILDVGPETEQDFFKIMQNARTIIWNGPVGMFELPNFNSGTKALGAAVAESEGFSIAGGGDTVSAIELFQIANKIDYISTAGGAFLEFIEGKTLPAIAALTARSKE